MTRYIDADAVVWEIEKDKCGLEDYDSALDVAIAEIKTFKTADVVEVVHGEWKPNNLNGFKIYNCSNCGIHMEARWNYCPHCGADMRERREDER